MQFTQFKCPAFGQDDNIDQLNRSLRSITNLNLCARYRGATNALSALWRHNGSMAVVVLNGSSSTDPYLSLPLLMLPSIDYHRCIVCFTQIKLTSIIAVCNNFQLKIHFVISESVQQPASHKLDWHLSISSYSSAFSQQ